MTPEAKDLLEQSILEWRRKRDVAAPSRELVSPTNCPLCRRYNVGDVSTRCDGCPIFEHTGWTGCVNSPYEMAEAALNTWGWKQSAEWVSPEETDRAKAEWRRYAQVEIDFLMSLLPKEQS